MRFHGLLHVWKVEERQTIRGYSDKVVLHCLESRGPAVYYDARHGFDCYKIFMYIKKSQEVHFLPGYIISVEGVIKSFYLSKVNSKDIKFATVLECTGEDVGVVGKAELGDIELHLKQTGNNWNGIPDGSVHQR